MTTTSQTELTIKQLETNQHFLLKAIDTIHQHLCPNQSGTWQDRVHQSIQASQEIAINNQPSGSADYCVHFSFEKDLSKDQQKTWNQTFDRIYSHTQDHLHHEIVDIDEFCFIVYKSDLEEAKTIVAFSKSQIELLPSFPPCEIQLEKREWVSVPYKLVS